MGTPVNPYLDLMARTSPKVAVGGSVIGSVIKPFLNFYKDRH